jgi:thiamine transport system substrate-binding protein
MKKLIMMLCVGSLILTACSSNNSANDTGAKKEVVLLAYDSFTPEDGIFEQFTNETGYTVKVVSGGDSGAVVSKAILTAGNPEGDVLWGVDNTALSRVEAADVFDSYEEVNTGDICVNIDIQWFASRNVPAPTTLEDLIEPQYKNLLVVQDPVSSSPGLGFLLATIAHFGEDNWSQYWSSLHANGVLVAPDWTTAYYTNFSGSSGKGDRPLVVSYGSSPPAEVVFSDPPVDSPPTSVMENSCFRQVEYVGVLRGSENTAGANALVSYLLDTRFQESMPLTLFVYPVNPNATLPEVFTKFAVRPANPLALAPDVIADNRDAWLEKWREIVLS